MWRSRPEPSLLGSTRDSCTSVVIFERSAMPRLRRYSGGESGVRAWIACPARTSVVGCETSWPGGAASSYDGRDESADSLVFDMVYFG
ncbi:hypothetical protein CH063_09816 [Colletotrichum higginsianum]|uniref:Uncharacterized protein n=1 Tax=Colletotrichum higginsianum (strain IMI 349063) TaxID=759273 RepID=H1VF23_COLHI|nr:hypothetical protein CH063_09816 [Colletotrichum higginsianum]